MTMKIPSIPSIPSLTALVALVLTVAASGCAPVVAEPDEHHAVTELVVAQLLDHPTALGVLALVNDAANDEVVLEDVVGLRSSASDRIVAHRRGLDRRDGTADDVPFRTITELDEVAYVGEVSLRLLGDAALALGYVPALFVEGVAFSEQDVHDVMLLVNTATLDELDDGARLDARAANALVGGRPYHSVPELGELPYVGPVALEALLAYAATWLEIPPVAL